MTAYEAIAQRRLEKATYFAGLLYLIGIKSEHLDPRREMEWLELQHAAATHGRTYGVPSYETRLCILALLREYEFRGGRKPVASAEPQENTEVA